LIRSAGILLNIYREVTFKTCTTMYGFEKNNRQDDLLEHRYFDVKIQIPL
jgi:hypothetical protein